MRSVPAYLKNTQNIVYKSPFPVSVHDGIYKINQPCKHAMSLTISHFPHTIAMILLWGKYSWLYIGVTFKEIRLAKDHYCTQRFLNDAFKKNAATRYIDVFALVNGVEA